MHILIIKIKNLLELTKRLFVLMHIGYMVNILFL